MKQITTLLLVFLFVGINNLLAQCTNGSQPECTCATAPVLCSVDELDNYVFTMAAFQHPQDGPTPLCAGASNSVPNNPTWFAFTAWCTDLTLNVSFSNCTGVGGSNGVQIAIYGNCNYTDQVACNVNPADCNTNDKVLMMTGLTIGDVYYFLVDGCLGSYCTVTIDVVGTCGNEEIAPWTLPITGETEFCAGESETYTVEDLVGAGMFHWFIDGVEQGQTVDPNYTITWNTPGSYQLCVDASNEPCVPITDPPPQICVTITVSDAEAGTITATPATLCPGETSDITVTGYLSDPNNTQVILITDASGVILDIIPGDIASYSSSVCETITVCSYNYTPGSPVPSIGQNISSIDCTANCCDLECTTIVFEDNEIPVFPNGPASMTLTCSDLAPPMADLEWTDNCDGMGMVPGMETGMLDVCTGGSITRTWEYTDACGNIGNHTQTISADPAPIAAFLNPPADITVDCNAIPANGPDLIYSNNGLGACLIGGFVSPVESGTADICGGTITYTWTFTDLCSRTITHTQNVTVNPAPEAAFVNPPGDMTVDCDNIPTGGSDLSYTNNGPGTCLIDGMVSPMESGSADICGGTITYTWEFTDACNRTITHVQNITVTPATEAAFVNPPGDMTVDCDNIPTGGGDLAYTNNGPGACLIDGMISPMQSGSADICGGTITYTWEFTDACNRTISHVQNITVTPATEPAFVNPPGDMTVDCDNIPTGGGDLAYTNNGPGACLIDGLISPTQSGSADICGGTITYTWTFTDACGRTINHLQNITVTPASDPAFLNPPADYTTTCDNAPSSAPDLNYTNNGPGACLIEGMVSPVQSGSYDECGGTIIYTWAFTNSCGFTLNHVQTVTIDPAPQAAFIGALPQDMTVDCNSVPSTAPPLNYTNNEAGACLISGSVPAVLSGSFDPCGGAIIFTWTFTDNCGRTIQHVQTYTVNPAPPAAFTNLPGPLTLACSAVPGSPPNLSYTNNESGNCAIAGAVTAIQSGFYDSCGGNITYTWAFTDGCNRTISHSQDIIVEPASDPMFVNPPPDITINCGEPFPFPIDLPYTNGENGNCAITGTVPALVTVISPLVQEYFWTFTNTCNGFTITHIQVITQNPEPDIIINPTQVTICEGESFDLSTIVVVDQSNTSPNITYHSGTPATLGNQLPSPIVSPLVSTTYYILATNAFGCSDEAPFDVIVEEPPSAGIPGTGSVCYNLSSSVDLFSFLNGSPDLNGNWLDTYGYGVNLSNPFSVDLFGLPPGTYIFDYVVPSTGVCPDAMSSVQIELLPEIEIEVLSIACNGPDFYEVLINTNGFTIVSTSGTVTDLGGNQVSITNIPIGNILTLIVLDPLNTSCFVNVSINPPDCDCPTIDPPMSNGNESICEGEPIPELSVTVGPGETANWYDVPSGGVALLTGSLTYTPAVSAPGIYNFYVETENIADGCLSSLRTLVQLEIVANPEGTNAQLEKCDEDQDGFTSFDLTEAENLINTTLGYTFQFFESLVDAQNGTNPIGPIYTNTATPSQDLFVVVANADSCTTIVELNLLVHLPPIIDLAVSPETCLGDGDGSANVLAPTGANYSLDNATWTSNPLFGGLLAGNYTIYVEDGNTCVDSQSFTIDPGLELILSALDISCDNNGSASDATDDFYTITFTVNNNLNTAGTYTLNDGTSNLGVFTYGLSESITVAANGQSFTLTYTDDALGCTIQQAIGPLTPCSTDCTITIDQLDIVCSDNGTDTDATDDFYTITINASAINGAANNTYNVFIGGVLTYNYTYGQVATFTLPADGTTVIIAVVDNQDAQCQASQSIGPLMPCSDACLLNGLVTNIQCDDGGTDTDPSDDTFTFELLVTGINTSAGWELAGGLISGVYGTSIVLGPYMISDGDQVLTIIDNGDANCTFPITAAAPATCSDVCAISFTALDIFCNDNGTVSIQTDDFYEVTVNATALNGSTNFIVLVDGLPAGTFAYGTGGTITIPADGSSPLITIQDENDTNCTAAQAIGPLDFCTDECILSATVSNVLCDDNGTNDPGDDTFTFELLVTGQNTSSAWGLPGGTTGAYGTVVLIGPFPISAGDQILTITDAGNANCTTTATATAPAPCSPTCEINFANLDIFCNDNGTVSIQTDDFYEVTVDATVMNGSANFVVLVDGIPVGTFAYGTGGTITLPADGSSPIITIQDENETTCTASQAIGPLDFCTDECILTATVSNILCNDNGTNDPGDDTYTFELLVTGQNASAGWILSGGTTGTYGTVLVLGPYLISAGDQILTITDTGNANCTTTATAMAPAPCSPFCEINFAALDVFCNDNGTVSIQTDDFYEVTIDAIIMNGSANFIVLVDGIPAGTFAYGTGGTITLPADGSSPIITIQDENETTCTASQAIGPLDFCTDECILTATASNILCNDNGTNDPSDDTYTFELLVTGQNTSAVWGTSTGLTGVYGTVVVLGPYLISDGDQTLTITDTGNANCITSATATAPVPCSPTCVINFATLDVFCNDNGTISIQTDDFYEVTVDATIMNGSANFVVLVDGIPAGTFAYGTGGTITLPADGSSPVISIEDENETTCTVSQAIGPLDFCTDECILTATVSNILCNDNGTNDPGDDTYTFELLVSGQNTTGTWLLSNGSTGAYGIVVLMGPYLISAGDQILTVEDAGNAACNTMVTVMAPASCSPTCVINFATLDVFCNDNGTISIQTDDFYEVTIDATIMNGSANFVVLVDGIPAGTFAYGTGGTITLIADGSSPVISIQDENEATCTVSQAIGPLDFCTDACMLSAIISNITCDDNGTGNDSSDDTFTFELLVNGQNTSAGWTLTDGSASGTYGGLQLLGPFLISDGDRLLTIRDNANAICTFDITAVAPAFCSACLQTITVGTDATLTCVDTTALLMATSSEPGTYQWLGPNGLVTTTLMATVSEPGTYYFTATYADNCVATDSVLIEIDNEVPMADAGPDQFLSCDILEVYLDGSLSSPVMDIAYEWTDGTGLVIGQEIGVTVNVAGTYYLQLTDTINGCQSALDEVVVLDSTAVPLAVIYADPDNILDCIVSSILLYTVDQNHVEYTWNQIGGSTVAREVVVTEPGTITLTALDTITGCSNTDQIIVTDLEDYPIVNIAAPPFISCYDPEIVIDATASQFGPNIIYNWYDGLGTPIVVGAADTLLVDLGGFYILELIDTLNGCENSDTIFVESFLDVPLSEAAEDVYLACEETQTLLDLILLSSPNNLQINWTSNSGTIVSGGTTLNPSVDGTGYYYVSIQDLTSGCIRTDSLEVFNNPDVPKATLADINSVTCLGYDNGRIFIDEVEGGVAPYRYTLNDQSSNSTGVFSNLSPGTYDLEITDSNGCKMDTSFVIEEGVDLELSLPAVIELLLGETGIIEAMVNVPEEELQAIQWTPQGLLSCDTCLTTSIQVLSEEEFVLTILHLNGCLATASLRVVVRPDISVYIPNGFSPNGDGINDGFTLYGNDRVEEIETMKIFDRWGEEIFSNENFVPGQPQFGWDGSFRGEFMNPAVFVYLFTVRMDDGTREQFSGDVTLVR